MSVPFRSHLAAICKDTLTRVSTVQNSNIRTTHLHLFPGFVNCKKIWSSRIT